MRGKIPLGVLIGAALVVAVGAAGVIWAATSGGSTGDTAQLVPEDAIMYATINTDAASRQWVQTSQLFSRLEVAQLLRQARDEGLSFAELDWESDVAPFLGGEATIAAVPGAPGDTPGAIVILSTRDGAKAWDRAVRALDELAGGSGVTADTATYRGATIRSYADAGGGVPLSMARKDSYLIFGTGQQTIEGVLDLADGKGKALANLKQYRDARAAVSGDPMMFVYVNPAAAGDLAESVAPTDLADGESVAASLRSAGLERAAVAFAASAERDGLRFETQLVGVDKSKYPVALPNAPAESRLAARAPADTLFFLSGADLYNGVIRTVKDTVNRLSSEPDAAEFAEQGRQVLDEMKRELGFDPDRDFAAYLTGEYALAIGAGGADPDSIWGLAMATVRDAQAVGRTLTKWQEYERKDGHTLTPTRVGDVTVTDSRPGRRSELDVAYQYSLVGNDLLIGFNGDTVTRALRATNSLANSPDFQAAINALPKERTMTMYVNLGQVIDLAEDASGGAIDDDVNWNALRKLRFLALAATQKDDRFGGVAYLRVAED